MSLVRTLLPQQVQPWACCRRRQSEHIAKGDVILAPTPTSACVSDNREDMQWRITQEQARLQSTVVSAWRLGCAGLALGLTASVGFVSLWFSNTPRILGAGVGRTELAFDSFEQTLKTWDSEKTATIFAEDVIIRFYNQRTREDKTFLGRGGAVELLQYATGFGCAMLQDTIIVREVDEAARTVYIMWDYPKAISSFCGPSAEMYVFDSYYRISRLNALVDWRLPHANATREAFDRFETTLKTWDLDATAATFAEDAVVRFHNRGTGEERIFEGRAGAKDLLLYAEGLGCARLSDTITAREIDEEAKLVYISWKYSSADNISSFCGHSAETYLFDKDYKISRIIAAVDWRLPRARPTL